MTTDHYETLISNSLFDGISSTSNGGALVINNIKIHIFCCKFHYCQAEDHGGAFIFRNSISLISNIYFEGCYVRQHQDAHFGNCFYASEGKCNFETNSLFKCGPDSTKGGDSAVYVNMLLYDIKHLNASNSFGESGAGSVSIWNPFYGSTISYIQCIDITDHNYFELWFGQKTISKSNFINHSGIFYSFLSSTGSTLTIQDCFLINSPTQIVSGGGTLRAINCQSDVSYEGYGIEKLKNKDEFRVVVSDCKIQKCITNQNYISYIYLKSGYSLIILFAL